MSWLAKVDTHVKRWPAIWQGLYLVLKWGLAALGAYAWIGLWFQRGFWLGMFQLGLVAYLFWREVIAPPPSDASAPAKPR